MNLWSSLKTAFGLVPCGILREQQEELDIFVTAVEQLNKNIERMWQIDDLPRDHTNEKLSVDEIMAVESMLKNLRYNPISGRFTTRLLWRGETKVGQQYCLSEGTPGRPHEMTE